MNSEITIQMLLRQAHREPLSPEQWKWAKARCAWALGLVEKWYQAMCHRDEVCTAAVERLSEEEFNRLFDREEAKVEALRAEIDAVIERDEWPLEMYFGGI
jgi:hypothetical protein